MALRGTAATRGYGTPHATERKRRLANWRPGDPCARCGQPMWGPSDRIDLGHTDDRTGYIGLEHAECNRADGARRGNAARGGFTLAALGRADVRCHGCGQPYVRAARACEICGAHYHPTHGEQRTCGRACGVELVRRNKRARGWVPKAERPKPPRKERKPGPEPKNGYPSVAIRHYTCRYCGKTGAAMANSTVRREVCPARPCQLARITANNLRVRNGMTQDEADAQAATLLATGAIGNGRWQTARAW